MTAVRRGRRRSPATTLADILAAARVEFSEQGFEAARVEQMARTAGVSKQLIYHYFTDKAALYGLILEEAARGSLWLVDRDVYDDLPPLEAMTLFVQQIFDDYILRPALGRMLLDEALHEMRHVHSRGELLPIVRRVIDEVVGPILERGVTARIFRNGVDPTVLFWTVFSVTTAWSTHKKLMTLVSGPRFEGEGGAALWRDNSVATILTILRPDDGRES